MSSKARCLVGVLACLLAATPAAALTDEEIFREFRFNFINPGGRSTGMGGAFIAVAEDATAAEANPAALDFINKQQIFAEYRVTDPDPVLFGSSFGSCCDVTSLDLPWLETQTFTVPEKTENVGFASYVLPLRLGKKYRRMVLALSRQVQLDQKTSLPGEATRLQFSVEDFPQVNNNGTAEQYKIENVSVGALDAEIVNLNFSLSYGFNSNWSVGVTATQSTLTMQSLVVNTTRDPNDLLDTVNPRVETAPGSMMFEDIQVTTAIDDEDSQFTGAIGLNWHPRSLFKDRRGKEPLRLGLVYKKGAKFTVNQIRTESTDPTGTIPAATTQFENTIRVPDRYGIGIAYLSPVRWTVSFDAERVNYSDLLEDFRPGENFFTGSLIDPTFLERNADNIKFDIDDEVVIRVGAEFFNATGVNWSQALRVGYRREPDARIRLEEFNTDNPQVAQAFQDTFRAGEDEDHFTVGFGLGFPIGKHNDLVLDVAADFWEQGTEFVGSLIFRFGNPPGIGTGN